MWGSVPQRVSQGGKVNVESRGKKLHSVTTLQEVLAILHAAGKVDDATRDRTLQFLSDNQVVVDKSEAGTYSASKTETAKSLPTEHTFGQRAQASVSVL